MNEFKIINQGRRDFLTKVIPACAASCLGASQIFAGSPAVAKSLFQQEKHRWDKAIEVPTGRELTPRLLSRMRVRNFIRFAQFLEKELGKERMIELVKKSATERLTQSGKKQAKRLGKTDLKSYTAQFKGPGMQNSLTMEILEDTDKIFEIKVTECLIGDTYLQAKAGDIGYAAVCWGDYAWAESFNPKIKLVRDKTLMQGHDCCNHRYVWTG